jgi:hypothetical protein
MTGGASAASRPDAVISRFSDGVRDARRLWRLLVQSSVIGTGVGLLPGVGAGVSQWVAYGYAARRGAEGRAFGDGAVEGVIAPSAANNATLGASLVPAVALGVPGGLMSAILISALILQGLTPGPGMLLPAAQGGQATLVFALVWLIVLGNVLAVALACLGSRWLVRIAQVRPTRLVPPLLLLIFVGAFAQRQSVADVFVVALMGALGLVLVRYRWPRAPLLLGVVLGPLVENRFFLSMDAYGSQWLWRPGVIVVLAILAVGLAVRRRTGRRASADGGADRSIPSSAGEVALIVGLVGTLVAAYVATAAYPPTAALVPRLIIAATTAILVGIFLGVLRRRATGSMAAPTSLRPRPATRTAVWIVVYPGLIIGLGFVVGGLLAVVGHLVIGGERSTRAVAIGAGVVVALYVVLFRLLGVALPPGVWF